MLAIEDNVKLANAILNTLNLINLSFKQTIIIDNDNVLEGGEIISCKTADLNGKDVDESLKNSTFQDLLIPNVKKPIFLHRHLSHQIRRLVSSDDNHAKSLEELKSYLATLRWGSIDSIYQQLKENYQLYVVAVCNQSKVDIPILRQIQKNLFGEAIKIIDQFLAEKAKFEGGLISESQIVSEQESSILIEGDLIEEIINELTLSLRSCCAINLSSQSDVDENNSILKDISALQIHEKLVIFSEKMIDELSYIDLSGLQASVSDFVESYYATPSNLSSVLDLTVFEGIYKACIIINDNLVLINTERRYVESLLEEKPQQQDADCINV